MRMEVFGATYSSPIFTCPTSAQKAFSPDGEMDVARAAKKYNTLQWLSTVTGSAVEDVNAARGQAVWQQLYAPADWEACRKMLDRFAAAGCTVIALTVDNTTGRHSETYLRLRPRDLKQCQACHSGEGEPGSSALERRSYDGINMKGILLSNPAMDWAFADKIRKYWKGKFLVKGIDTREDARMAIDHGLDGILVSNHGGRATETLRGTIQALPEVVAEVNGRVPVFIDGGFRRGTDVFKALALGAKAVGIGRPMLWGLGAFGQAGVEQVLEIMNGELKLAMGNCGTRTPADITREYVMSTDWKL
jgi:4-hydroxymandelate oxidase